MGADAGVPMRAWLVVLLPLVACVAVVEPGSDTGANSDPADPQDTDTDPGTDTDTPPVDTDTPPDPTTPPGDGSVQQLCVDEINSYRATLGLAPYDRWASAESCSDDEARSDSETGIAHGAFGSCGEWAQNECPGWFPPYEDMIVSCLEMMWAEGPGADFATHGHYINMSSTSYTKVACGFYTTPSGSVWSVQNFQ